MIFSRLSLGTWTFAGDAIWSDSPEKAAIDVLRFGAERGVRLFDTAPNYGNGRSESILGKALGNRDDVYIASKCKIEGLNREELTHIIEGSLRNLRREAIDLMQIHWPSSRSEETSAALDLFEDLKREGKIREIGVCNFGVEDMDENRKSPLACNQLPYSLMWRVIEENIGPYARERGIPVLAYSPLQQGLLSGLYADPGEFPEGRKRTRHYKSPIMLEETGNALKSFLAISQESGIEPVTLAISYVLSKDFIDSVLAGARTADQLNKLLAAVEYHLPDDVQKALDKSTQELFKACGGNPDMYGERVRYTSRWR
ncbi:MAG: aldo/keto reductase [Spirochaetales bacterium]|nr:aldo/keto reductase [Spirochaetales bacterium]